MCKLYTTTIPEKIITVINALFTFGGAQKRFQSEQRIAIQIVISNFKMSKMSNVLLTDEKKTI